MLAGAAAGNVAFVAPGAGTVVADAVRLAAVASACAAAALGLAAAAGLAVQRCCGATEREQTAFGGFLGV